MSDGTSHRLRFYGGLIVTLVTFFALGVVYIYLGRTLFIALIVIGSVFLLLLTTHYVLHLHGKHRRNLVAYADEHRLVLMEGTFLRKQPVVYETNKTKHGIRQIEEVKVTEDPLQLPAPRQLPQLVRYEDIRTHIPHDHVLVGISEDGVQTREQSVKGLVWVVGGSGSGKSNTVALRVEEDYERGHRFLGIDPHAYKDDSLTNAVQPYLDRFLLPIAQSPEDILHVLDSFLCEFKKRKDYKARCYPLTLLVDEVGSLTMDKPEDAIEVEIIDKIKQVARIGGQEVRGFNMGVTMISQDAAFMAWLRKRALMVLGHKVLAMSERDLVCNHNMEIARDMDNWPIGRTVVYGIAFRGVHVLQQPLFTQKTQIVDAMPDLSYRRATHETEPIDLHSYVQGFPFLGSTGFANENVMNGMNEPIKTPEQVATIQVTDEEKALILAAAHSQFLATGKVIRTKVRDALKWNNGDFPKIKMVLDQQGI